MGQLSDISYYRNKVFLRASSQEDRGSDQGPSKEPPLPNVVNPALEVQTTLPREATNIQREEPVVQSSVSKPREGSSVNQHPPDAGESSPLTTTLVIGRDRVQMRSGRVVRLATQSPNHPPPPPRISPCKAFGRRSAGKQRVHTPVSSRMAVGTHILLFSTGITYTARLDSITLILQHSIKLLLLFLTHALMNAEVRVHRRDASTITEDMVSSPYYAAVYIHNFYFDLFRLR